jgi:hypothetical protein
MLAVAAFARQSTKSADCIVSTIGLPLIQARLIIKAASQQGKRGES